jgi:ssDNA-binding Zn-finger/Zn-ribbon topoisomerase 1
MSKCRDCGAEVIWAKSKNGKPMPLDAKPLDPGQGKFVLYDENAVWAPDDGEYTCHLDKCTEKSQYTRARDAPVVKCPKCHHKFVAKTASGQKGDAA